MGIEAAIIGSAVAGAVGTGVSASMTNSANKEMADNANRMNQQNADTAHQREVRDLRAAGLNPILSAGGNGAAVPTYEVPRFENPLSGISEAMSNGITNATAYQATKQIDPMIDKMKSEAKLNEALQLKAAADTTTALSNARRADAETASLKNSRFLSQIVGSDAAGTFNSFATNTADSIFRKLKDVISNTHQSSAKKVSATSKPAPYVQRHYKRHDGSRENLLQPE